MNDLPTFDYPHTVTYQATIEVEVDPHCVSMMGADFMSAKALKTLFPDEGEVVEVSDTETDAVIGRVRLTIDKGLFEMRLGRIE